MSKKLSDIPFSILDLATIVQGDESATPAFRRSLDMARHAERLGFYRYWFAEHHNMESVASAATSVLVGYVAGGTTSIRVGSGGVMLPNHAPLIIAEQFGTLASLYPGRIDLGIGRAPGTDPVTSYALRRSLNAEVNEFPKDVVELLRYLGKRDASARVRAIPGEETFVPVWLLGSSTFSAQLAGMLGLPFAFASHFAPALLHDALNVYHNHFSPSDFLDHPHTMACVNVIATDTNDEADKLATSFYQLALGIFRNDRHPLPPPVDNMDEIWTEREKMGVMQMTTYLFKGNANTIQQSLQSFVDATGVDELMISSHLFDHEKKKRSLEIIAGLSKTGNRLSH